MPKIGLKLWSSNLHYAEEAKKLYDKKIFDYIELSAIPNTFKNTADVWKSLNIPYIIHAPHFMQGLNFSNKEKESHNMLLAMEAFDFADKLNAKYIIFHPGIGGDFKETARQIKKLNDKRIIIENKPYNVAVYEKGLTENDICVGYSPQQIKYIAETANIGVCLDIGHCFCAANSIGKDKYEMLNEFLSLKPKMFHISDGDINSPTDKHYLIGHGSYDFQKIFSLLPKDITITLETEKPSKDDLDAFVADSVNIRKFIQTA